MGFVDVAHEGPYRNAEWCGPCARCGSTRGPYARTTYDEEQLFCPDCGAKTFRYIGDYYDEGFMDGSSCESAWNAGRLFGKDDEEGESWPGGSEWTGDAGLHAAVAAASLGKGFDWEKGVVSDHEDEDGEQREGRRSEDGRDEADEGAKDPAGGRRIASGGRKAGKGVRTQEQEERRVRRILTAVVAANVLAAAFNVAMACTNPNRATANVCATLACLHMGLGWVVSTFVSHDDERGER